MTSEWRYYSEGIGGIGTFSEYTTIYFDGLETINGNVYYKRYTTILNATSNPFNVSPSTQLTVSGPLYFREDIDGKFYFFDTNNNQEVVYFDNSQILNAQIGDTYPDTGSSCNVQSIGTISLGSASLKKINSLISGNENGAVEGIGHVGLSCIYATDSSSNLVCYTKRGFNIQFMPINCNLFPTPIRANLATNLNVNNELKIETYPNPTNDILNIKFDKNSTEIKSAQISDLSGRIVLNETLENQTINVKSLSIGTYILMVKDVDGKLFYQKFIKE